jgi:transcriptional regulator with XRE-family HTH domain
MLKAAFFSAMNTEKENVARQLLARNLRVLRKAKGCSQEEFADLAGFHRTYVSQIERGIVNVTIDNLQRIADVLEVKIDVLFRSA